MFVVLYSDYDDIDVLMCCESESDAYEMVLSFAQERIYENWYGEIQLHGYSDIDEEKWWYFDYFVLKVPYIEME